MDKIQKLYKKTLALVPEVREEVCDHSCGGHYTGSMPGTGRIACFMCGATLESTLMVQDVKKKWMELI